MGCAYGLRRLLDELLRAKLRPCVLGPGGDGRATSPNSCVGAQHHDGVSLSADGFKHRAREQQPCGRPVFFARRSIRHGRSDVITDHGTSLRCTSVPRRLQLRSGADWGILSSDAGDPGTVLGESDILRERVRSVADVGADVDGHRRSRVDVAGFDLGAAHTGA
jgi:hypothetical protein